LLSTDSGVTWTPVNSGLPYHYAKPLAVCDSFFLAGIGLSNGVWRRSIPEMIVSTKVSRNRETKEKVPFNFFLPRLAGEAVALEFSMPYPGHATIKLYDVSGREATAIDKQYLTDGSYRYYRDIHMLTRGYYILRLQTGTEAGIKPLRIMR
jgi:hypothetical protein